MALKPLCACGYIGSISNHCSRHIYLVTRAHSPTCLSDSETPVVTRMVCRHDGPCGSASYRRSRRRRGVLSCARRPRQHDPRNRWRGVTCARGQSGRWLREDSASSRPKDQYLLRKRTHMPSAMHIPDTAMHMPIYYATLYLWCVLAKCSVVLPLRVRSYF